MDLSERSETAASRHPWELARTRFLLDVLLDHRVLASEGGRRLRVLDAGAGDAYFAGELTLRFPDIDVTLWDAHYRDSDIASLRARGFHATAARPEGPFDVVVLLDVLEHVDADGAFLHELLALAGTDARLLFSVPAWPLLWSQHDVALQHHRRYRPSEARARLAEAGLRLIESGGVFHGLVLPRALAVMVERLFSLASASGPPADAHTVSAPTGLGAWRGGPRFTGAITRALMAEQRLSRMFSRAGLDVPGLSFWALAERGSVRP